MNSQKNEGLRFFANFRLFVRKERYKAKKKQTIGNQQFLFVWRLTA